MLAPQNTSSVSPRISSLIDEDNDLEINSSTSLVVGQRIQKTTNVNIGELLNIEVLRQIRTYFVNSGVMSGGIEALSAKDFIKTLTKYLPSSEIECLYKKIDVNDDGFVDWQEFTGFLTTPGIVNGGQYSQEFHLQHEQDINSKNNHKELINVLCYCRKPFPMFASYAEDGKILLWHSTDLHYLGSITHYDKSMVLNEELLRNLTVDQKTYVTKTSKAKINSSTKRVVCVISMVAMPLSGHLCVSSADSTIAMYDLASQELCGRITTIPDTPTCMTAFSIYEKAHDVKNQYLCIGDEVGYIYFVMFDAEFGMSSDAGAKKKNIQLFQNALTNMKRMRAQREGVTVLVYASELNQLIVAGVDGYIKFVNVSKKEINKSFHAHHSAIKCVAWSWAVKSMCTSALDRSVLVWDPYTFQISTKLEGFPSTIISVMVNERIQQLIVVFEDKTIRTWDSLTFEPLSTVIDPSVQSPSNCISASIWSQDLELLLTAGNRICSWHMEINPLEASVARDDDDLCTTLFNENFNTLLVVSKGGNVTVFSAEEGTILIKFSVAILSEEEVENSNNKYVKSSIRSGMLKPIVTTAMLDKAQRRLIIFNSNELQITLWNFNNGQCVSSFSPSLSIVSRIPLRERNNSNYIVPPTFQITCGTYEHVYSGPQRMLKRFCIFGTDEGIVAVNVETSEGFSDEPTFCLVRSDDNVRIVNQSNDTDNVQITYKRASVVWMKGCNENTILVSYSDGVILEWDLEKATPILEMKAMKKSLGLQFVPLRRKLITSRGGGGNRTENSDLKPASREGVSPTPNDATSDTTTNHFPQPFQSPVRRSMSISFERSTTGQFNVPLLITSQPSFSRADSSNPSSPSLAGSVTDVNEKITPMSSHKPRPPSAPRQLLTSYTAHTERLLAGDTSRTAGGNIVAPSAILGIARRTSNQVPSPRPEVKTGDGHAESKGLGEDIASSPRAKDVTSRLLPGNNSRPHSNKRVQLLVKQAAYEPSNNSTIDRLKGISQKSTQRNGTADVLNIQKSSVMSSNNNNESNTNRENSRSDIDNIHSSTTLMTNNNSNAGNNNNNNSNVRTNNSSSGDARMTIDDSNSLQAKKKSHRAKKGDTPMTVECGVVLTISRFFIGACADNLFRIWDMNNGELLCTCASNVTNGISRYRNNDNENNGVTCLRVNSTQDQLISGYENGDIRIWLLSSQSFSTLRTVCKGLAKLIVPPIQLLSVISAHASSIITVDSVELQFNYGSEQDASYFVSVGQDQEVILWSSKEGQCVGRCGLSVWDVNNKNTWLKGKYNVTDSSNMTNNTKNNNRNKSVLIRPFSRHSIANNAKSTTVDNNTIGPKYHHSTMPVLSKQESNELSSENNNNKTHIIDEQKMAVLVEHIEEINNRKLKAFKTVTEKHEEVFSTLSTLHPISRVTNRPKSATPLSISTNAPSTRYPQGSPHASPIASWKPSVW